MSEQHQGPRRAHSGRGEPRHEAHRLGPSGPEQRNKAAFRERTSPGGAGALTRNRAQPECATRRRGAPATTGAPRGRRLGAPGALNGQGATSARAPRTTTGAPHNWARGTKGAGAPGMGRSVRRQRWPGWSVSECTRCWQHVQREREKRSASWTWRARGHVVRGIRCDGWEVIVSGDAAPAGRLCQCSSYWASRRLACDTPSC